MKKIDEIREILQRNRGILSEKYGVRITGIFGSYARGEQGKKGDIDLLAEIEKPISLLELVGAENFLTELLGIKVDLIPREDIRWELKESILKEAVYL
jgi:predicted nucleotidyltransferase